MNLNMIKTLQKQLIRGGLKYVSEGRILGESDWSDYSPKPFVGKTVLPDTHAAVMLSRSSVDYPGQEPLRIFWKDPLAWGKTLQGLGAAVYFLTTDYLASITEPNQILKIGKASGTKALHSRMLQYSHGWFRRGAPLTSDGVAEGKVCSTNKIVMDSILRTGGRRFHLYAMFIPKKSVQFNGFWFDSVSSVSAEVVERSLVSQYEAEFGNKPICNVS